MLLEIIHLPGQRASPKAGTSWDSTIPILPEPAHPWPGSQGCLRILPVPLLMAVFGTIASLLLQVFREQEEV